MWDIRSHVSMKTLSQIHYQENCVCRILPYLVSMHPEDHTDSPLPFGLLFTHLQHQQAFPDNTQPSRLETQATHSLKSIGETEAKEQNIH